MANKTGKDNIGSLYDNGKVKFLMARELVSEHIFLSKDLFKLTRNLEMIHFDTFFPWLLFTYIFLFLSEKKSTKLLM